jgi:preprotein translocase subunit SecY
VANNPAMTPSAALGDAVRSSDIRGRLLFLIGALIVYRIGTFIPVPGIDPVQVANFFNDTSGTILGVVNMFSGGALSRMSIFAMGVMPYISASIIIQMMSMVVPSLMEYRKEGEAGRRKITQLTRYFTLVLGAFQSFAAAVSMQSGNMVMSGVSSFTWLFTATVVMTTGTMFLMWLGEQITERGVGNGISMLILVGIIAGLPSAVGRTVEQINTGEMQGPFAIALLAIVVLVTAFCVYVERAQRRITVNYAKRQVGRQMSGFRNQTSHLPFKLNMSGVIPAIFASSLLLFPATIAQFAGSNPNMPLSGVLQRVAASLSYGQPLHMVLYGALIIFFCFFYTALVFNARDTADNLKKSGAFIPGIRPGQQTGEYIDKVLTRLTLWGALYITFVCLVPETLMARQGVPFQFGGTSLLIVVVVVMDFIAQLQAHAMSHQYPGLMKKANLLGSGRNGGG